MILKKTMIFGLILFFLTGNVQAASWIDDWINQKTATGPNHFESQKRGMGTMGGFSARWKTSNDYLLSTTPPKFKSGCGGIDLFLGGYSFLKFDQLVDKFQRVMGPAAAAFAFDIAMSVLSKQASTSMKGLMGMIDRLNQLQFDDCKAAKALTFRAAKGFDPDRFSAQSSEAVKDFVQSSGVGDLYSSIVDTGKNKSASDAMSSSGAGPMNNLVNGCPQMLKDVFFTNGYVLDHLGAKRGLDAGYTALMRGIMGDFLVDVADPTKQAPVEPCPDNKGKTLDNFINGETYIRASSDNLCDKVGKITINGKQHDSIRDWIVDTLTSVADKIIMKTQDLSADETALLASIPADVFTAMEIEIIGLGVGGKVQVANSFADIVAAIQVYNMMNDFYATMDSVIRLAQTTFETQRGTASGTNQHTCKVELAETAVSGLFEKKNELAKELKKMYDEYLVKLAEVQTQMSLNQTIRERKKRFVAKMSNVIGKGAAQRVTGP